MGKLVEFFINHKLLVTLIVIFVFGLGLKNAFQSRKEGFPEVSINKINIVTLYPGASAKDVEVNVTMIIEDTLKEVEGIQEIVSVSEEGISSIIVQVDDNATGNEFQDVYTDVDNALAKIDDLPKDIDGKPTIKKFTSKDIPVMEIAFSGPYEKLKKFVPFAEAKIKKINGVAAVDVVGLPDDEVHILVDPVKAKNYMVGLGSIAQAIQKRNLEGSGGTLESFIGEQKIVSFNKFEEYDDVLQTNVLMSADGFGIKLKQVATIAIVPKEMNLLVRNNGKRGVVLAVKKSSKSDILKTVDRIKKTIKECKIPKDIEVIILSDQSDFTRSRLDLLKGNALVGFALVAIILFLIFNLKTAIWTAFGIPFSLFGVFIFLNNAGITLNLISLGGFIIVLGMLVDDAIVIAEEINSNKEKGMQPKQAAIEAVKNMWLPVAASSLTTIVAFTPLLAIGGLPGKFIWVIPVIVTIALLVSLFESFFILPSHLYHGKSVPQQKKQFVVKLENIYSQLLGKALQYKYIVLSFFMLLLLSSLFLMKNVVTKDAFPQESAEGFYLKVTLSKGSSEEAAIKEMAKIEKIMLNLPKNEIIGISTRIGTQSEMTNTERGTQSNLAIVFVYLTKYEERNRTANDIIQYIRPKIAGVMGSKAEITYDLKRIGPPLGRPFEIRISTNDEKLLYRQEHEIKKFLATIDGISDISNDEIDGKDELNLLINHDLLSRTGLSVEDVLLTLRIAFDGQIVTNITRDNKKVDYRLRLNKRGRADHNFIQNLPIVNRMGNFINLGEIVSLHKQKANAQIRHVDAKRTLTLFGNLNLKKIAPIDLINKVRKAFPSNELVEVSFAGEGVETKKIFSDLGLAALTAFIGVFLIIALVLNSLSKPFIIISVVPFGLVGIVFVLLTHGLPISMFAGIAMVGLMGVIVNSSIVMVHTISSLAKGKVTMENVAEGAISRLRPMLLTTITTVLGVLPTGYGIGGYDPFLSHMCITLAYGLLFSTLILLFLVPVLYGVWMDVNRMFELLKK